MRHGSRSIPCMLIAPCPCLACPRPFFHGESGHERAVQRRFRFKIGCLACYGLDCFLGRQSVSGVQIVEMVPRLCEQENQGGVGQGVKVFSPSHFSLFFSCSLTSCNTTLSEHRKKATDRWLSRPLKHNLKDAMSPPLVICYLVVWGLIIKNCVKIIYPGNNKTKICFFFLFL